jgi:hypothetical protein
MQPLADALGLTVQAGGNLFNRDVLVRPDNHPRTLSDAERLTESVAAGLGDLVQMQY